MVEVFPARTPENPSSVNNGLDYAYYEDYYDTVPDFSRLTPKKTGIINTFSTSVRDKNNDFAFQFSGYVEAPADGVYSFYVAACDGMKLWIGSTLLAADNTMGDIEEYSGSIGLKAGKHAITVGTYFRFGCGLPQVQVKWKGPGIAKALVPPSRLFHVGAPALVHPTTLRQSASVSARVALYDLRGCRIKGACAHQISRELHTAVYIAIRETPGHRECKPTAIVR